MTEGLPPEHSMHTLNTNHQFSPELTCKNCHTYIVGAACLLSKAFRGYAGKAALFTQASNISLETPRVHLMDTGAHTIQELTCTTCSSYLGWKIVRAHEFPEKWKEGNYLLELELLEDNFAQAETEYEDATREFMERLQLGHRRTSTDSQGCRERPHGPRSLPPSLRPQRNRFSVPT